MTNETLETPPLAAREAELAEARTGLAAAEVEKEAASRAARENPQDEAAITRVTKAAYRLEAFQGRVADLAVKTEETGKADRRARAVERLSKGIPRAHGSLVSEYRKDMEKVVAAARELKTAVERLNGRYKALELLRWEAEAVAERFELPRPLLPLVLSPVRLPEAPLVVGEVARAGLADRAYPSIREIGRRVKETLGGQLIEEEGPTAAERRAAEKKAAKAVEEAREAEATMAPMAGHFEAASRPRHGFGF